MQSVNNKKICFAAFIALISLIPIPGQAIDWSGGYVGGQLTMSSTNTGTSFPGTPTLDVTNNPGEAQINAFAGYNWTLESGWVLGIEADINLGSSASNENLTVSGAVNTEVWPIKIENALALRARAGRVFGQNLIYGAAGLSHAEISTSVFNNPGDLRSSQSLSLSGWNIALGLEHNISENVRFRAETRYTQLNGKPVTHTDTISTAFKDVESIDFRLGLSFRF